jgi:hypothetical protein
MAETRKLAAILAADVVGYSKLAGADEDRTLARLRALRSALLNSMRTPSPVPLDDAAVMYSDGGVDQIAVSSFAWASILAMWSRRATAT